MTCTFGSASEPSTTAAVEFVEGHADAAPIEGPASRRHRAHGNDAPGAPISALATGRPRRRTTELSPRRTAADVWRLQILLGACRWPSASRFGHVDRAVRQNLLDGERRCQALPYGGIGFPTFPVSRTALLDQVICPVRIIFESLGVLRKVFLLQQCQL